MICSPFTVTTKVIKKYLLTFSIALTMLNWNTLIELSAKVHVSEMRSNDLETRPAKLDCWTLCRVWVWLWNVISFQSNFGVYISSKFVHSKHIVCYVYDVICTSCKFPFYNNGPINSHFKYDNISNLSLNSVQSPNALASLIHRTIIKYIINAVWSVEYLTVAHTHTCNWKVYAILTMRSCQDKHWYMVSIWRNKKKKKIPEKFSNVLYMGRPLWYENGGIFSLLTQFIFEIKMVIKMSYALVFSISHNSKYYKLFIWYVSDLQHERTVRTPYNHEIIQSYSNKYIVEYGINIFGQCVIIFQNFRNYTCVEHSFLLIVNDFRKCNF